MFAEHQNISFPIRPKGSGGRIPPVTNNCERLASNRSINPRDFLIEPKISPSPTQPEQRVSVKLFPCFAHKEGRGV
jgi:hypothetical protein